MTHVVDNTFAVFHQTIEPLQLFRFNIFASQPRVRDFVTTRVGGISNPPYASLNLSFRNDDAHHVALNRNRLSLAVNTPVANMTLGKQVHGDAVAIVNSRMRGSGAFDYESAIESTDAMVTKEPHVCLIILVADCVPLAFYDRNRHIVGVAHAGWKGTCQFIAKRVVDVFRENFDSNTADLTVGIGPSIGPCCYSLKPDGLVLVSRMFGYPNKYITVGSADGKQYIDLWSANVDQLVECGIPPANIEVARICTCHNRTLFFSERCDGAPTGRFALGMTLL
jgi:YfiH family protein